MRPEKERHVLRVNKLYTAAELTDVLMVATDYVDRMANKKAIPFICLNGTRMYCGWMIREWLDKIAVYPERSTEEELVVKRMRLWAAHKEENDGVSCN